MILWVTEKMNAKKIIMALSYLGVLPFAFGLLLKLHPIYPLTIWIFSYGAVIASFIAGSHWSLAMTHKIKNEFILLSNVITLVAWICVFIPNRVGILLLIMCFVSLLFIDYQFYKIGIIEKWYMTMRKYVTLAVTLILLCYALMI